MKYFFIKSLFFTTIATSFFIFSTNKSFAGSKKYYLLNLYYNKVEDSIKLTGNKFQDPISLTDLNFTHDTGKSSQFYAQMLDSQDNYLVFDNGTNKFFLGKWTLTIFWDKFDKEENITGGKRDVNEGEKKISIPYFPDGKTIEIRKTSNNSLALSIDVSRFSENINSPTIPKERKLSDEKREKNNNNFYRRNSYLFNNDCGIIFLYKK